MAFLAGFLGGFLGIGGGLVMGPVLLELGLLPEVPAGLDLFLNLAMAALDSLPPDPGNTAISYRLLGNPILSIRQKL